MSKRKGDPGYRAGWCIHYRGITGPDLKRVTTCEKGVEYSSFLKPGERRVLPCFLDDKGQSKPNSQPCEHLRRPTPEEIAASKKWSDDRFALLVKVMKGIKPWREKHLGKSHSEVVECPGCKGRLHLSISSYNGHVHGRCETDGCVAWME